MRRSAAGALFCQVTQSSADRFKVLDLSLNFRELFFCQAAHVNAFFFWVRLDRKKLADVRQRKAKILGMLDELNLPDRLGSKHAVSGSESLRLWQETFSFIVSDSLQTHPSPFCEFTNPQII